MFVRLFGLLKQIRNTEIGGVLHTVNGGSYSFNAHVDTGEATLVSTSQTKWPEHWYRAWFYV